MYKWTVTPKFYCKNYLDRLVFRKYRASHLVQWTVLDVPKIDWNMWLTKDWFMISHNTSPARKQLHKDNIKQTKTTMMNHRSAPSWLIWNNCFLQTVFFQGGESLTIIWWYASKTKSSKSNFVTNVCFLVMLSAA